MPGFNCYVEIHKKLKQLRAYVANCGKQDVAFKKKTGEMRRAIRGALGQLTSNSAANKASLQKVSNLLRESLTSVQSPPIDPSQVMLSKPAPDTTGAALNNGDSMPALFIYLLNVFAKAIIAQFCDEAGVAPQTALPIGIIAVTVFSHPDFFWRGKTMIDILIAKMAVVCPVLFGVRGNEKTEEGRARLGWKKNDNGSWIPEQMHNTRMTGLGAGYAAICLRDFSKSTRLKNPWAPTHYWQSMSRIVNTPPHEASPTQFMVLKSMIDGYEASFLRFFGNAALAALQIALVHYPARFPDAHNAAAASLMVLADKLKRDLGLDLRAAPA